MQSKDLRSRPATGIRYRLGLPAWAFPGWRDLFFSAHPSMLANYAKVFNTVEGNTTFYRIPDPDTIAAWRDALAATDCKIAFKLPKTITHARQKNPSELAQFIKAIEPIEAHCGPLLIQLPAWVGPRDLSNWQWLFDALPNTRQHVLEVRHTGFFGAQSPPAHLADTLDTNGMGWVMMDTRALFAGDLTHPEVRQARHEKPDLPVVAQSRNQIAFVRLVLHPDPGNAANQSVLEEWAVRFAQWLEDGIDCWLFMHCPNNLHCPEQARQFHELLRQRQQASNLASVAPLPEWPVPQQTLL